MYSSLKVFVYNSTQMVRLWNQEQGKQTFVCWKPTKVVHSKNSTKESVTYTHTEREVGGRERKEKDRDRQTERYRQRPRNRGPERHR